MNNTKQRLILLYSKLNKLIVYNNAFKKLPYTDYALIRMNLFYLHHSIIVQLIKKDTDCLSGYKNKAIKYLIRLRNINIANRVSNSMLLEHSTFFSNSIGSFNCNTGKNKF